MSKKISELPNATALSGTETIPLVQAGETRKTTVASLQGVADNSVSTVKIQDGAVTAPKIASDAVTTAKIANSNVTFAKIQNISSSTLLGRTTVGAGVIEEISVGAGLTLSAGTLSATGGASAPPTINPVTATVAANALTVSLLPTSVTFRSSTLSNGNVNIRTVGTTISLVVPSSATLGTTNATAARLVLLALDNAGTVELAILNSTGGLILDESALISTTAISAAATAANVIYSTTARTNVPFRIIGFLDSTQATAGTWATTPSLVQGSGGEGRTPYSGRLINIQRFTASGTYTRTPGTTRIFVQAMAGGGGGGNAGSNTGATGGSGGQYVTAVSTSPPASAAVTIGAGGGANTAGGNTILAGIVTATGGGAGVTLSASGASNGGGNGGGRAGNNAAGSSAGANTGAGGGGVNDVGGSGLVGGSGGSGWLVVWEFA